MLGLQRRLFLQRHACFHPRPMLLGRPLHGDGQYHRHRGHADRHLLDAQHGGQCRRMGTFSPSGPDEEGRRYNQTGDHDLYHRRLQPAAKRRCNRLVHEHGADGRRQVFFRHQRGGHCFCAQANPRRNPVGQHHFRLGQPAGECHQPHAERQPGFHRHVSPRPGRQATLVRQPQTVCDRQGQQAISIWSI